MVKRLNGDGRSVKGSAVSAFRAAGTGTSAYIAGVDPADGMILPFKTNGLYEITKIGRAHTPGVSHINGKEIIKLPAVADSGVFRIKLSGK